MAIDFHSTLKHDHGALALMRIATIMYLAKLKKIGVSLTLAAFLAAQPALATAAARPEIPGATELADWVLKARAVYWPTNKIKKNLKGDVYVQTVKKAGLRYLIETDAKAKIQTISVQGTRSHRNVLTDLNIIMKRSKKLKIMLHGGVHDEANRLYKAMKPRLRKDNALRFTGHSLGGAVGLVLAMMLEKDGYKIDRVVTFGQPKITNSYGAEKYRNFPLVRVVHEDDPVPRLPSTKWWPGKSGDYEQFGREIIITSDERYVVRPEGAKLSGDGMFARLSRYENHEHKVSGYFDEVRRLARKPVTLPWKVYAAQ